MLRRLSSLYPAAPMISMARAIDIMGAAGYKDDSLLSIYFRDAKVCSIVGGTDNVQKMIIASLL